MAIIELNNAIAKIDIEKLRKYLKGSNDEVRQEFIEDFLFFYLPVMRTI